LGQGPFLNEKLKNYFESFSNVHLKKENIKTCFGSKESKAH
jgi:hypothetical protein